MTFKLIDTHEFKDIQSNGEIYEHLETGAKVLFIENDDPNKAFTIAFRTPPYNDNGIAHIIEHSVLNGSNKYPSKEPFVEVIKGSLNTFANAMTYPDQTMYPVASTNHTDFQNLVSVYLDAVFQPNLLNNPQILAQEGWHYHLEHIEDNLIYKGVVYNEMKGAMGSPERAVFNHMKQQLYRDSFYENESGGLPSAIPTLTQEEFIEFHNKYYHPSNSLTVFYGDFNQDLAFNALAEYFDKKEKATEEISLKIEIKKPEVTEINDTYSIADGDDPSGKDYLSLAWHVTTVEDDLDNFGLEVLSEILFGNNQAPLKKALLEAEIGEAISGGFSEIGYPNAFVMNAKNTNVDRLNDFKEVVASTLSELVKNGIPKELIEASINSVAFELRESTITESEPRGVINAIKAFSTWSYGVSPYSLIDFSDRIEKIRSLAENGYFEKLIEEKLINNDYRISIALSAEPGKNDRLESELNAKLQSYKNTLSEKELLNLVEDTQTLIKRQETPDTAEDLAKIPTLTRKDLSAEVHQQAIALVEKESGMTFYHADEFTSGIDYLNYYLDLSDLPAESFANLSVLSHLLGNLDTENYSAAELQTEIDTHTGGINGHVSIFETKDGQVKPFFVLKGKALENSSEKLIELMSEILLNTKLDDENEILKLVQSSIAGFQRRIERSSHALASQRALSQLSATVRLSEQTSGIDYYNYLKQARQWMREDQAEVFIGVLKQNLALLANAERFNVLMIGTKERYQVNKGLLVEAFSGLEHVELAEKVVYEPGTKQKEAFITAQDVNYVGLGAKTDGRIAYEGSTNVITTLLRYDYLWNTIRVMGGAYGAQHSLSRTGNFSLSSYRDPNIGKTIDSFLKTPDFLSNIDLTDNELTKIVIGTINELDQPLSAYDKGYIAFLREMTGQTIEDFQRLKEEVIATSMEEINAKASDYQAVLEDSTIAVIGNKAQIDAESNRFDVVYELN